MKKLVSAALAVAALSTTGCAGLPYMNRPVIGTFSAYASTQAPEMITDSAKTGGKSGEGCTTSILGLITTGNSSVAEAARKADITRISFTENTFENILGIYAKYCVVVHGE